MAYKMLKHGGDPNHLRPSWDDPPSGATKTVNFRGFLQGVDTSCLEPGAVGAMVKKC